MEWFDYFEMKKKKKTLNEKTLSNIKKKTLNGKIRTNIFLKIIKYQLFFLLYTYN
jgi:hypothetical protein